MCSIASRALTLADVGREHLFLIALGRRPKSAITRSRALRHDCSVFSTRWTAPNLALFNRPQPAESSRFRRSEACTIVMNVAPT